MAYRVTFSKGTTSSSSTGTESGKGTTSTASALIYNLGGMCIRDYQLALQHSANELKSREHQVNSLYSCLLDREETIARLNREIDSLKSKLATGKTWHENTSSNAKSGEATATASSDQIEETNPSSPSTPQTAGPGIAGENTMMTKPRLERLRAALAKNNLLGRLDSEQADGLISQMNEERVLPSYVIIGEGEAGTRVYILEEGEVDISRGGQFLCRLLSPIVFGELAVIYNSTRSATVTAATHCHMWTIESVAFHKCMARIRQRTADKIAIALRGSGIFCALSKSKLSSIIDAGEEFHYRNGAHVSVLPSTLYVLAEGNLVATALVCSCGDTDGHRIVPVEKNCRRRVVEMKAPACFFYNLPDNIVSSLFGNLPSATDGTNHIFQLSQDEIQTLKVSEDNKHRGTCYCLDTNFLLHALNKSRSVSPNPDSTNDNPTPSKSGTASSLGLEDLCIFGLLPTTDSFSHVFCVTDTKTAKSGLRRNAVYKPSSDDSDPTTESENAEESSPVSTPGHCYALRWVLRQRAESNGIGERLNTERQHLLACQPCKFIVQLVATMQDSLSVYLLYELCLGGTLECLLKNNASTNAQPGMSTGTGAASTFSLIANIRRQNRSMGTTPSGQGGGGGGGRQGGIEEEWARFYLACVIEALDFLHSIGIIHRNLCPASVAITAQGYAKLGEFKWTKSIGKRSRTFSICGAVERLAPEVMLNKGHGLAADRWATGILLYEMLVGKTPFVREDPMLCVTAILQHAGSGSAASSSNDATADTLEFPRRVSKASRDAIRRLCRPLPGDRIAFEDMRRHQFFSSNDFSWEALRNSEMAPPFVPNVVSKLDVTYIPGIKKLVSAIPVASLYSSCGSDELSAVTTSNEDSEQLRQINYLAASNYSSSETSSTAISSSWSKDF